MAKREGLFDDFVAIAARFPWWLGVLMAGVSYSGLHYVAISSIAAPTTVAAIGSAVTSQLVKTAAGIGQYIVPIVFLVGAAISALGRRKRNTLYGRGASEGLSAIATMTWREYEMLIGEAFRRRGFRVLELGGQGADGGVDLVLAKQSERHVVQCKHWRATKVPVAVVRELYGVMAAQGAVGGFVVTAGEFTREARDFASGRNVELINGAVLAAMLREGSAPLRSTPPVDVPPSKVGEGDAGPHAIPDCPKCGQPMVIRVARQGANTGNAFWGCSGFPACRGVRPLA